MRKGIQDILKWGSLCLFSLLSITIIVEASLPGDISAMQSNFFASIFANIINANKSADITPQYPTSIAFTGGDKITIGTTGSYTVSFEPKDATRKGITFSSSSDKINIVQMGAIAKIEALVLSSDPITVTATSENGLTAQANFTIVRREAPTNFTATIDETSFPAGTTKMINIAIANEQSWTENIEANCERYYDPNLLTYSSSDSNIATCENGVILGKNPGNARISIDGYPQHFFDVTITNETVVAPTALSIPSAITRYVYDLDYDTQTEPYHTLITPDFGAVTPTDSSVRYVVEDDTIARVDSGGKVFGYKRAGTTRITAYSNMDNSLHSECIVTVEKAQITQLNFVSSYSINQSSQLSISPSSYYPKNASNLNLVCTVENETIVSAKSTGRSILITGLEIGQTNITISSEVDSSVSSTISITVNEKPVMDEKTYNSFVEFVRKSAGHFLLFFNTAFFGFFAFYLFLKSEKKMWLSVLFSGMAGIFLAGLSEFIQVFADGRSGSFADVGIDSLGYLIMTFGIVGVIYLVRYIKKKKASKVKPDIVE